jgi:CRP-like cAMP-binding protein
MIRTGKGAFMSIEFLRSVRLFNKLSDRQLNLVAALLNEEEVKKDSVVIKEGEVGKYLYIIKRGNFKVVKQLGEDEIILTELGEKDFFGELSLIDEYPTSANVVALEDGVVLKIKADDFSALTKIDSGLSAAIWESLARCLADRVRKTSDIVKNYYGLSKALCENEEFRLLFAAWNFEGK